jgi:hypothetical protein
VAFAV